MLPKKLPTYERVKELFTYADGALIRRTAPRGWLAGSRAGSLKRFGYRLVCLDGVTYPEHRIIWLLLKGREPSGQIDHIDFNRSNNRIENLRECTSSQNNAHQAAARRWRGITFHKGRGKFQAQISVNRKNTYLGLFETRAEAAAAYDSAAVKYFGEFAVINGASP